MYQDKHKEEEKSSPEVEVFRIHHKDVPKGTSQCEFGNHKWVQLNDNEVKCINCPTVLVVSSETLKELL